MGIGEGPPGPDTAWARLGLLGAAQGKGGQKGEPRMETEGPKNAWRAYYKPDTILSTLKVTLLEEQ